MPTATANGKKFTFPDGTTPEQMGQAIDEYFGIQADVPRETQAESVLPAPVAEAASAINRGVAQIPDFFIDAANAATGLISDDIPKIPRVQDTLESATGGAFGQQGFMEPGLARDIVQQGGEVTGSFLPSIVTAAPEVARQIGQQGAKVSRKLLRESAPSVETLKQNARRLYKEVDDLGIQVNQSPVQNLSEDVASTLKREGHNARVTPKVQGVIDELDDLAKRGATVSEIDTARKVARAAAISNEPAEQRLGAIAVDKIDDFLANLPEDQLVGRGSERVGPLLTEARGLWSRAKKGEVIEDMIQVASDAKSGFENGLRNEAIKLLKNKKRIRGFTADEVAAIRQISKGTKGANVARLIGKFGLEQEQAVRALLPAFAAYLGAGIGGGVGAFAAPALGTISQRVATGLTANNANLAGALVRAGPDANKIIRAYTSSVPKAQRSADQLAALFLNQGVPKAKIDNLAKSTNQFVSDAAFLTGFAANVFNDQVPDGENDGESSQP